MKTIVLLGSGALKIGEAGEFDYSGSQAIKALKQEGKRVVVVNPNIATNQTSFDVADSVYFVPVNAKHVTEIIKKEKPDAIALSFGGQTALNCGLTLEESGVLKEHNVHVLGTSVEAIRKTEDRELFNQELKKIQIHVPRSFSCRSVKDAREAAVKIGFPLIVRAGFALGGKGSGRAMDKDEFEDLLNVAFVESPQVLVEEDLTGWKEIEYEVVRDVYDNCITVCNMENVDPLGIHTGESIVVAPSQTLDNHDYNMLRSIALKVIRHFKIVGECNIQYALHPKTREYRVIEVNARLSRSSALASKATGYPLAFIAAKLALGYSLPELRNSITKSTSADFEPALDYVAVKIPRWDLQKFRFVTEKVTSEMKSVGEIMALGRTFEEALQKGIRMLNIGEEGLFPVLRPLPKKDLEKHVTKPTPRRIFAVAQALNEGWTPENINAATGIDNWFLRRMANMAAIHQELFKSASRILTTDMLRTAKLAGFSDAAIAHIRGSKIEAVRMQRMQDGITPVVKQIDTLAGEFPAQTNYLYLTYHGNEHDIAFERGKKRAIVLGGGPYSIGSSVEFDWCCVQAVKELKAQGFEVTMINSNPETVSTDYDECDILFFEELTLERVLDIVDLLEPEGVVVSMGGQIPNSLSKKLAPYNAPLMGTAPKNIDIAEDRHKFSNLLDELKIDQPEWREFSDLVSAKQFAKTAGYPVIVRPSYVLSGAAMTVVHSEDDLKEFLEAATNVSKEAPVVVSKFMQDAKEIELDGVAQDGLMMLYAVGEHIENAGVHSGDSTIVMPPQRVNMETLRRIKVIAKRIAKALDISGPFNIQFVAKNNRLKVIECNLRASRSFPFASKVTGINFAKIATQALLHLADSSRRYQTFDLDHVAVKAAQFSFSRLKGADPKLGVEMASTGEVGCFGLDVEQALLLSLRAIGFMTPKKNILLSIGRLEDKLDMIAAIDALVRMNFSLLATHRTHEFLASRGYSTALLYKLSEPRTPNIREYLENKRIDMVINIPQHSSTSEKTDGYYIRRIAIDRGIPLITNVQLAKRVIEALEKEKSRAGAPLLAWPALLSAEHEGMI